MWSSTDTDFYILQNYLNVLELVLILFLIMEYV